MVEISDSRFELFFNINPDPILICYVDPDKGYETFFEVNDAAVKLTGYSKEELRNMTPMELLAEKDRKLVPETLAKYRKGQTHICGFIDIVTKSGKQIPVERTIDTFSSGGKLGVFSRLLDVSIQKSLERNLEDANRIAKLGTWEMGLDTRTMIWTEQVYQAFGYEPHEREINLDIFLNHIYSEDRGKLMVELEDARTFGDSVHMDLEIRKKDDSQGFIHFIAESQKDTLGNTLMMMGTIQDITEQKQLEKSHIAQEKMLVQQSKMASMGEMTGAIAHQWKQPLNNIYLISQNIQEMWEFDEIDDENLKKETNKIREQVMFMNQTIDDFRNFFKPSKTKNHFDLEKKIMGIYNLMMPQFQKYDIEVLFNIDSEVRAYGYPNEFMQVVLNVMNNARDVMLERAVKNGIIEVEITEEGGMGIVSITDNAGGIPEHLLPNKIFEAYISTKGDKGTGIGLSMSKTIIEENMLGEITASNTEKGARFLIKLPLNPPELQ